MVILTSIMLSGECKVAVFAFFSVQVVGIGASGRAAARMALARGASKVVGFDRNDQLPKLEVIDCLSLVIRLFPFCGKKRKANLILMVLL